MTCAMNHYSVVQFIDDRHLPPAYRFFHRHRIVDDYGKVKGYKHLDELREQLKSVLLRRTRESVLFELPERTTEIVRIPPSDEQYDIHASNMRVVAQITSKPFLTEMDIRRLQMVLLRARMAADSTFLVDKNPPGFSTKLNRFREIIQEMFDEPDRKAVLFSEWTTMLDLIEPILQEHHLDYVRLDGSVPQKKRQKLVAQFQNENRYRLFLTTNAGATGLNLQAANTIINMDLPWNPAILEQRIARAHRMGQKRNVQIYLFVTEDTIEENMLATLSAKHDLALAALDMDSDVSMVEMESGIEELKRRLEVLLGAKPTAPVDLSQKRLVQHQAEELRVPKPHLVNAGEELFGAIFKFAGALLGEETVSSGLSLLSNPTKSPEASEASPLESLSSRFTNHLSNCVKEENGRAHLSIPVPDAETIQNFTKSISQWVSQMTRR